MACRNEVSLIRPSARPSVRPWAVDKTPLIWAEESPWIAISHCCCSRFPTRLLPQLTRESPGQRRKRAGLRGQAVLRPRLAAAVFCASGLLAATLTDLEPVF